MLLRIRSLLATRRGLFVLAVLLVGVGWYYLSTQSTRLPESETVLVAQVVEKGTVTNGIQTSGRIEAAEVLDLNVYKLEHRIDAVSVVNGSRVEKGQLLYAFDESDAVVDIENSRLSAREAELSLQETRAALTDPNTTILTLENNIADIRAGIARSEEDVTSTLRTYLNADVSAEPSPERYSAQVGKVAPVIGGYYTGSEMGQYTIEVYASAEKSGYSFKYRGLEEGVSPVYLGAESPLGTRGLTVTFPSSVSNIASRDTWVVAVPNVYADEYVTNKETYEQGTKDLKNKIATDLVDLKNKQVTLEDTRRGDTVDHRDLGVESAALAIERARVDITRGIDARDERRIIAPFSGTVEGVQNVVAGATPSKDGTDSIDLGRLISDEFVATFSLGAADVANVSVGQTVLVSVTALPGSVPLRATVTEVSSLPDSSTVPQYEVRARLERASTTPVVLRDGMLADIEIVREERQGVLRVPIAAVSYQDGGAYVQVLETLSPEDSAELAETGVVRLSSSGSGAVARKVTLGLRGTYYVEVLDGLSEGTYLAVTETTTGAGDDSVVESSRGFGRPPSDGEARTSNSTSASRT